MIYYLLGVASVLAQSPIVEVNQSSFDDIKSTLENITYEYVDHSLLLQAYPQELNQIGEIYDYGRVDQSSLDSSFFSYRKANLAYKRPDLGMQFNGGYLQNFNGTFVDDDGVFYRSRVQAGLDWDILKGGFKQNKTKYEIEALQLSIDSIELQRQLDRRSYAGIYDYIIYLFNVQKIQLSSRYSHLLSKELEVAYQLYYLKYIHWEDVLTIMSKKAEIDIVRKNFIDFNTHVDLPFDLESTSLSRLPLLRIVLDSLRRIGIDTSLYKLITEMEIEKDRLQHHWDNKPGLKTYLRYNYYHGAGNSQTARDFVGAGVQVNVPIVSKKKEYQERLRAKHDWLMQRNKINYDNLHNDLLNHYYEYEYTHRQFVQFFHKKLMAINQINRELTKRDLADPGYSPIEVTKNLDNLYGIDLELLDIQQQMYLKLLKILQFLPADKWRQIVETEDMKSLFSPFHSTHKVKIKPTSLKVYNREFVLNYLDKNDVEQVIIPDQAFLGDLHLPTLRFNELEEIIHIDLENILQSGEEVQIDSSIQAVYIELKPYSLPAWQEQMKPVQQSYLEILENWSHDKELWISVPFAYDDEWIRLLGAINNRIVFKFFETTDPEMIIERLNKINLDPEVAIHAEIDCKSFLDRFQMEEFIQLLKEHSNMQSIILNDFEQLIELEANTVKLYEKQRF